MTKRLKIERTVAGGLIVLVTLMMTSCTSTESVVTPTPTSTSTPPTTTSSTTTTLPPVLPSPQPSPRPGAIYKIVKIGTIEIPAIKMTQDIVRGVALRSFDKGVGWWPGTARPGGYGNMVLGGHRTTGQKPFRYLDRLKPGDEIVVRSGYSKFTYIVRTTKIVDNSALWIIDQKPGYTATLFACHP